MIQLRSFGLSEGQSLPVAGVLDLILAVYQNYEVYSVFFYSEKERIRLTGFSHHLDYMEYFQLSLDTLKLVMALVFCIGGVIYAIKLILQIWMYLSMGIEVLLQLLSWIVKYHLLLSDSETLLPILSLTYCCIIKLLIRTYLCHCVWTFLKAEANPASHSNIIAHQTSSNSNNVTEELLPKPSTSSSAGAGTSFSNNQQSSSALLSKCLGPLEPSTSAIVSSLITPLQRSNSAREQEEWNKLLPVGQGAINFAKFFYKDFSRIATFLITLDLSWGICRMLEIEMSQAMFGSNVDILPSSTLSAPIWTEERIIRLIRVVLDIFFLRNISQGEPPLKGAFIIPKLIEIFVSTGILIFLRIVEHDLYPSVVFSFFYAFYSLDIVFRIITFIMCYKIYGDFLRYRHRMVVSKNKSPSLLLRSDYS